MFRDYRVRTILGTINSGVLISGRRGYLLSNADQFKENVRGFYVIKEIAKNLWQIEKLINK
jgi:hypothetical protein